MIKIPQLHHKVLENLFFKLTFTEQELREILSFEKNLLTQDLLAIINFCSNDLNDIDDEFSYNLLIYALFLLKENENENQLDLILKILRWPEDIIDYWFGDFFTDYFWIFVYHFGQNKIEILVDFLKEENIETFSKEEVAMALYQIYLKHEDKTATISQYWTKLLEFHNNIPEVSKGIDYTYLAFFVSYIAEPNAYQTKLIKKLHDKKFIDQSINGSYEGLFDIIEPERKVIDIFDINEELIRIENRPQENFNTKFFNDLKHTQKNQPIISEKKPGRNDTCPCGSGKKYKKCCIN